MALLEEVCHQGQALKWPQGHFWFFLSVPMVQDVSTQLPVLITVTVLTVVLYSNTKYSCPSGTIGLEKLPLP